MTIRCATRYNKSIMGKSVSAGSLYLVLYNAACTFGWAYCLFLTFTAWQNGSSPEALWTKLRDPLTVSY